MIATFVPVTTEEKAALRDASKGIALADLDQHSNLLGAAYAILRAMESGDLSEASFTLMANRARSVTEPTESP